MNPSLTPRNHFGGGDDLGLAPLILIVLVLGGLFVAGFIWVAAMQYAENSGSPRISVSARVAGKRSEVSGGHGNTSVRTSYFVTFEGEGGERRELPVKGHEFGVLMEGDKGTLTYQGTWFQGFVRTAA